jgi:hypothetical protein
MGVKINGKKIKLEIQNNVDDATVSVKPSTSGSSLLQLYHLKIKFSVTNSNSNFLMTLYFQMYFLKFKLK